MPSGPNVLRKNRSLGTMAVQQERKIESQGSSSGGSSFDGLHLNEPQPVPRPRYLPPPTAPKRPQFREAPRPVEELPRIEIPPPPPIPEDTISPPPKTPLSPLSPLLARARSKRRTIKERIEGWWDLDLLDKRATLFGRQGSRKD